MLKDNSLQNRLNAVKNGDVIPEPPKQVSPFYESRIPVQQDKISLKEQAISKVINLSDVLAASFLYGYAINTVFSFGWNLLGSFAVGFLFNHLISVFPRRLFPNFFK